MMQITDGLVVPGNVGLDADALQWRIDTYYKPYHEAIARAVDEAIALGKPPVIVSIHSFTQAWKGVHRPWGSACCGTRTRGSPFLCSRRCAPFPESRSATTFPIRDS